VAPYARQLIGVDLSAGMLAQAKEKHVYDDLIKSELVACMRERPEAFDLIVSADTLCYFGALEDVVIAAARALRVDGLLVFTLERAVDESVGDFQLEIHGRYSHARGYVERLLAGAGLIAEIVDADLRMESGVPVAGLVIRAVKRPQTETHDG
jgi:predicted TPR repeat methyltransferase